MGSQVMASPIGYTMSGARPWCPPSPGNRAIKLKPIITDAPLEQSCLADKKRAVESAAEYGRETKLVKNRTMNRVFVAHDRQRVALDKIKYETDKQCASLQQSTERDANDLRLCEDATSAHVAEMEEGAKENLALEAQHANEQWESMFKISQSCKEESANFARVDFQLRKLQDDTGSQIEASKADAASELQSLRERRTEVQVKLKHELENREERRQACIDALQSVCANGLISADTMRHRASQTVNRAGELAQSTRTCSQLKVFKNETKADEQVLKFEKDAHRTQAQCDVTLKEKLGNSRVELELAHNHCQEVTDELKNQASQYKRRMREIEARVAAHNKEVDRNVRGLEEERLDMFVSGQQTVAEVEEWLRTKREASDADIEDVNRRLHKIEQSCQARAQKILDMWAAGSRAAEEAVRNLEEKGRATIQAMQEAVSTRISTCMDENRCIQKNGTVAVEALERQANEVVDLTQQRVEDSRREDSESTASALAALRELRPQADALCAAADKQIEKYAARAEEEQRLLQQETETKLAEAKGTRKSAHEEEELLKADTAAAWAQLRSACYHLRLASQHDFAQGVMAGDFDLA